MITKTVIKDFVLKKCPYLASLELEDKTLVGLLKESIESKKRYMELYEEEMSDSGDDEENSAFDLYEVLKDYPHLKKEIFEFEKNIYKNPVEELIDKYNDNQLISKLAREYFELIYGKENCRTCDVDENGQSILNQNLIQKLTKEYIKDSKVKVIFEGQVVLDNLRARFDVLIRNHDGSFDLIEVKGTNDVFDHPVSKKIKDYDTDSRVKSKYLYDLLFQYYIYKNAGIHIKDVGYMFTNRKFQLKTPSYPVCKKELDDLFVIKEEINLKSGTISLKEYFDSETYIYKPNSNPPVQEIDTIETIIDEINNIAKLSNILPKKRYLCRKGPACPFMDMCFDDATDPNSIFRLTNWNAYGGYYKTTMEIMDEGIEKISDIPLSKFDEINVKGKRLNVYTQIKYQKGEIKEKYLIDINKIQNILEKDYLNEDIKWLVFFDFESFQHCIPLVNKSNPWTQVVCQYSMHILHNTYDLTKHNFEKGTGGNVTHFEFIGSPDDDKFENPSLALYKTLKTQLESVGIDPMGNDYRVIVFNKNFEVTRLNDFYNDSNYNDVNLKLFVSKFKNNVVDLLDFFTSGSIYCKDFNGRGSLKVVQPTFSLDTDVLNFYKDKLQFDLSDSLDYHKGDKCLVYNGAICLDLYKSLLIRSHFNEENIGPSTKDLLKEALAYCKIDSWGTVIIFDIIKNIFEGNLKLDSLIV